MWLANQSRFASEIISVESMSWMLFIHPRTFTKTFQQWKCSGRLSNKLVAQSALFELHSKKNMVVVTLVENMVFCDTAQNDKKCSM